MTKKILIAIIVVLVAGLTLLAVNKPKKLGSVGVTDEYSATTTSQAITQTSPWLIKTGAGTLGSVVVTQVGTAGGTLDIVNATTTNINARTGSKATSSLIIASLPTNLAAGTYTFDVTFNYGLLLSWTGTVGTTTITWR